MTEFAQLLVFRLDQQRFALPLAMVDRVVQAVEVTPLPGAPAIVMGAIDVEGRVLPVVNLRRRFLLPEREIDLSDQFLIARSAGRALVLVIDEAQGVVEHPESTVTDPAGLVSGLEQFQGVAGLEGGLVLIQDLEKFLSLDEAQALDAAVVADA